MRAFVTYTAVLAFCAALFIGCGSGSGTGGGGAGGGDWIVFTSQHDLWIMRPDGTSRARRTSSTVEEEWPALNPAGDLIAFTQVNYSGGLQGQGDIGTVNFNGTGYRLLTNTPEWEYDPTFSPDGQWIVYSRDSLRRMRVDGTGDMQIRDDGFGDEAPSVSPDGQKIVFARLLFGGDAKALYLCDFSNGENLVQLTFPNGAIHEKDNHPVFSRNGQKILFDRENDTLPFLSRMFSINPDGSGLTQLTPDGQHFKEAAFSRDGTTVLVSGSDSPATTGTDIWSMSPDGSNRRRVTSGGAGDGHPCYRGSP